MAAPIILCDTAGIYGPCAAAFGMEPWHESLKNSMEILTGMCKKVHNYDKWEREGLKTEENPLVPYNVTEKFELRTWTAEDGLSTGKEPEEIQSVSDCNKISRDKVSAGEPHKIINEWEEIAVKGRLLGGCLDCLATLCGTKFDKVEEFNEKYKEDGVLWFLEACDLNVMGIRRALWQLDESGWFKNTSAYNTAKQKMLKSVYQNGGFWVGRYEAGIEDETNIRKEKTDTVTLTPVTKKNVYPYNYVTRTQAKVLAEQVEAGSYTSSLMFGVQWDLILKFIEKKTVAKVNEANKENVRIQVLKNLNEDSTNVGNYYNSLWNITNTKAKFSADSGSSFNICPQSKKSSSGVLLTTGADIDFSLMNIYDIAGNVWEFTLENTSSNDESSAASRGGSYGSNGFYASASYRAYNSIGGTLSSIGFRTSLY